MLRKWVKCTMTLFFMQNLVIELDIKKKRSEVQQNYHYVILYLSIWHYGYVLKDVRLSAGNTFLIILFCNIYLGFKNILVDSTKTRRTRRCWDIYYNICL